MGICRRYQEWKMFKNYLQKINEKTKKDNVGNGKI